MKVTIEGDIDKEVGQLDKEQAEEILRKYLRHIKKVIKSKIGLYEPLDFKTALKAFLQWVQEKEYRVIREFPGGADFKTYLNSLIRKFLVEKTYYHFLFEDQSLVENYVRDILIHYSIPLNLVFEIATFVREKLETRKKVASVKRNFDEKSKLKTYFYTMIVRLVADYQEKYNVKDEDKFIKIVELNDTNDLDKLTSNSTTPLTEAEINEIKERVEKLPDKEKLALKLYYYDDIKKFSILGRILRTTRYKAEKMVKNARDKVLKGDLKNIKREKKNDSPGN
jgi:RNA polymerase sigma factor (sigma-70 family)